MVVGEASWLTTRNRGERKVTERLPGQGTEGIRDVDGTFMRQS